jgi:hypothetical protein
LFVELKDCCSNLCEILPYCTEEDFKRLHQLPHIETQEKLDDFIAWAEGHDVAEVREWLKDKKPYTWFVPALNPHFSKIPRPHWVNSPKDTNLNESSHPWTNQNTGINLAILESIVKYVISVAVVTLQTLIHNAEHRSMTNGNWSV